MYFPTLSASCLVLARTRLWILKMEDARLVHAALGRQEMEVHVLCEAIYYVKLHAIFLVKPSEIIKLAAIMSSRTSHNQGDPTWGCELSV